MTARILVVDDVPANAKLLEARLLADYFEVMIAHDGPSALAMCAQRPVDLILLDIMMPGMDGFEVCERLKADAATAHIPVVMVTALDGRAERVRGLEAGADDFLTKPVNDLQLMTRVKSLVRLKALGDELRARAETATTIGVNGDDDTACEGAAGANLLLVDARINSRERIIKALSGSVEVTTVPDPQQAVFQAAEQPFDIIAVSTNFADYDPLRLCSQLRSLDRTRFIPIVLIVEPGEDERVRRALEIGVNDYIVRPVDSGELAARMRTQIARKRYNDRLRRSVTRSIEMAVTDSLTGLHNRHYLENHLSILVDRAAGRERPLSICTIDIDAFKAVNDSYGHEAGDDILREFANRIRGSVRGADLACRYGGEEFVVVMPDTTAQVAGHVAERLRVATEAEPFAVNASTEDDGTAAMVSVRVTASFGIATFTGADDSREQLLRRSDRALYQAKRDGRNRVVNAAA